MPQLQLSAAQPEQNYHYETDSSAAAEQQQRGEQSH